MSTISSPVTPTLSTAFTHPMPTDKVALTAEIAPTDTEINIFALLRQLTALVRKLQGENYHQKALQSLHQFHLQLNSAEAIRNIGNEKWKLGLTKICSMLFVMQHNLAPLPGVAPMQELQSFSMASQAIEGVISISPQSIISDNEAQNKENDAYVQSTHAVLDGISKQLDQLSQMLRELISQTLKEIQQSRHQALGSIIRA